MGVEKSRDNAELHFMLGMIRQGEGNLNDAEAHFRKAADADATIPDTHVMLGLLLMGRPDQQAEALESAEKAVQEIAGQIRLLKLMLESKLQCKIPVGHPIIAWIIEFAPQALNYFSVGRDGKTAYERLKGRRFRIPIAEFGERVHMTIQSKKWTKRGKMNSKWDEGIFLGFVNNDV